MPRVGLTLYQSHVENWKNCERCDLSKTRRKVVIARGSVPCHVLFVGEAPGISEDAIGLPFVGPAGKLLDQIIQSTFGVNATYLKIAMTNVIGCIPMEEGDKTRTPPKQAVKACKSRLESFIRLADPQFIVAVGQVAQKSIEELYRTDGPWQVVTITHPAAILRASPVLQDSEIQKAQVRLMQIVNQITPY